MPEDNSNRLLARIVIYSVLIFCAIYTFFPCCPRSKVSQAESEMRQLQNALDDFFINNHAYPISAASGFISEASIVVNSKIHNLTTPVAYLSTIPFDPFHYLGDGHRYDYSYASDGKTYYILTSWGPDSKDGLNGNPIFNELEYTGSRLDENRRIKQDDAAFRGADRTLREFLYDASNGVASAGEIIRVGP